MKLNSFKKRISKVVFVGALMTGFVVAQAAQVAGSLFIYTWTGGDSSIFTFDKDGSAVLLASTSDSKVEHRLKKIIANWPDKTVATLKGSGSVSATVNRYNDEGKRQSYYINVSSSNDRNATGKTWAEQ